MSSIDLSGDTLSYYGPHYEEKLEFDVDGNISMYLKNNKYCLMKKYNNSEFTINSDIYAVFLNSNTDI